VYMLNGNHESLNVCLNYRLVKTVLHMQNTLLTHTPCEVAHAEADRVLFMLAWVLVPPPQQPAVRPPKPATHPADSCHVGSTPTATAAAATALLCCHHGPVAGLRGSCHGVVLRECQHHHHLSISSSTLLSVCLVHTALHAPTSAQS
jgi:hypothetical protein